MMRGKTPGRQVSNSPRERSQGPAPRANSVLTLLSACLFLSSGEVVVMSAPPDQAPIHLAPVPTFPAPLVQAGGLPISLLAPVRRARATFGGVSCHQPQV